MLIDDDHNIALVKHVVHRKEVNYNCKNSSSVWPRRYGNTLVLFAEVWGGGGKRGWGGEEVGWGYVMRFHGLICRGWLHNCSQHNISECRRLLVGIKNTSKKNRAATSMKEDKEIL